MGEKAKSVLDDFRSEIEKEFLGQLRECEELQQRQHGSEQGMRDRVDGEYQRDYTRILYSSSFRRLQGKMQLFAVQSDQFIRNRLTHSLEVAQIARSIAGSIGYTSQEIYVVEACALAHDIGNPAFGHAGERFLHELSYEFGGFEGNAQTLRILTTVEQKRGNFQGLNLTYRTLLGVLKYYNRFDAELGRNTKQKFIYDRDYELISEFLQKCPIEHRTLDVQIMDLADEIAYAAHDLEDGLRLGTLKTDEVLHDFWNMVEDEESKKILEKIFDESRDRAGFKNRIESAEYSKLYRKEITSRIIYTLINDIGIVELEEAEQKKRGTKRKRELGFVNYGELASGLKNTIYKCVTNNNDVFAYEKKGEHMLRCLFEFYNANTDYLPSEYRVDNIVHQYAKYYSNISGEDKDNLQRRLIIDYISGMMDEYVKSTFQKLQSVLEFGKEEQIY